MLARLRLKLAWRPARTAVVIAASCTLVLLLFVWNLGTQPAGLSPAELAAKTTSNLTALAKNPFYGPWRIIQDLFLHIANHSNFLTRLPSVIFAGSYLFAFYWLLKGWFGKPIGFLTTLLLGLTPLYILLARDGTPRVMNLMPIIIMAAYVWLMRSDGSQKAWLALLVSLVVCLYVPGVLWLVLIGAFTRRKPLAGYLKACSKKNISLLSFGVLVACLPLILSFVFHPDLIKSYFLIPADFDHPLGVLSSWGWMMLALFAHARQHETLMLGRLPLLNAAQVGLAVFGAYIMWSRLRSAFYWLFGLVAFICLAAGLNNNYYLLAMALPLLAILVGMGLRYLYIEWVHIFPTNPLPRYFAIGLMAALVIINVFYGVRYGLVAWPHSLAVNHLYVLK